MADCPTHEEVRENWPTWDNPPKTFVAGLPPCATTKEGENELTIYDFDVGIKYYRGDEYTGWYIYNEDELMKLKQKYKIKLLKRNYHSIKKRFLKK